MTIEPYDANHLEGVVRLSLRAWAPVFDSLKQVFAPSVYDTFYPQGWRVSQDKAGPRAGARRIRESWIRLVPCRPLLQETVGQDHEPQSP